MLGQNPIPSNSDVLEEDKCIGDDGNVRNVCNMSLSFFWAKLIEHFDIKYSENQIIWPKWSGLQPYVDLDNWI